MNSVVVIYGPTAVGKSAIGVELAKLINGEIISADSMQIYRHLDIGSAKIAEQEMDSIKHHLINIKEPNEEYSVSEFCHDAKICINNILNKGHVPIVVGGTGLYIKSLILGYDFAKTDKNEDFRLSLSNLSNEEIYNKIKRIDPNCYIDKNNRRRLIRQLEKLTFGHKESYNKDNNLKFHLFAILDDRNKIYERINNRVEVMVRNGLIDEAKYLLSLNLPYNNQAIKAIGYKEIFPYLKNEQSLEECISLLKQKSRNYAKRQITFLNQFDDICKINFCGVKETANIIYENLKGKL